MSEQVKVFDGKKISKTFKSLEEIRKQYFPSMSNAMMHFQFIADKLPPHLREAVREILEQEPLSERNG